MSPIALLRWTTDLLQLRGTPADAPPSPWLLAQLIVLDLISSVLYLQAIGREVLLGALLGVIFGARPLLLGLKNEHLGQLGVLVIKLLKALAVPLIFLSILDSFIKTRFTARQGARLAHVRHPVAM